MDRGDETTEREGENSPEGAPHTWARSAAKKEGLECSSGIEHLPSMEGFRFSPPVPQETKKEEMK